MTIETIDLHRYKLKGYKFRQQLSSLLVIGDLQDQEEFDVGAELALRDGHFIRKLRCEDIFSVADVYAMDKVRDALREYHQLKNISIIAAR